MNKESPLRNKTRETNRNDRKTKAIKIIRKSIARGNFKSGYYLNQRSVSKSRHSKLIKDKIIKVLIN